MCLCGAGTVWSRGGVPVSLAKAVEEGLMDSFSTVFNRMNAPLTSSSLDGGGVCSHRRGLLLLPRRQGRVKVVPGAM